MLRRRSIGDIIFDLVNIMLLILLGFLCFYPFWYVFAVSLNDNSITSYTNVTLWPTVLTLNNYRAVFASRWLLNGYKISIIRVIVGTTLSVLFSGGIAYALSRQNLIGRKFFSIFILIPMYLSGGLIPLYMTFKYLHMLDTFAVLVIGGLFSSWNIILLRTSISAIPNGLIESANIDGANDLWIYLRIVLPCSKPIFATITLFVAVAFWNDWYAGDIYISSDALKPIQSIMLNIINSAKASEMTKKLGSATGQNISSMVQSIKMATIMLTVMPIVVVYPFLQKYFVKGIMIGSLKG